MQLALKSCVIVVLGLWYLFLLPPRALSGPLDSYIEGAKKEGSVRLGVTLRKKRFGKPAGEKYLNAFQNRYPFLSTRFRRIGGSRERERVLAEMTAGIIKFDVVTISETVANTVLQAKLPRIVNWQKLGLPSTLIHPKNIGVSLRTPVFGIGYNRELVPDEVARTFTWETCTDPKWRGKTAMDDRPQHLRHMYQKSVWGSEKTLDYAKRWAANKPAVEASRSTAAQKLAVGAYPLICGMARRQVLDLQVYGNVQSIGIVYPEPIPVGIGDIIYVPRKAKHPNAAILFLAWTTTKEAQNLLDKVDFSGHPSFEGNQIAETLKGKKVALGAWAYSERSDDILAEILRAMGFPVVR